MSLEASVPVNNPMARITHVTAPVVPPAQCAICTRASCEDGFADLNFHVEWYGALYLCAECVREIGLVFGLIEPARWNKYIEIVKEQEKELETLRTSVEKLEQQVDALSYERLVTRGMLDLPGNTNGISITDNEESDEGLSEQPSDTDSVVDEADQLLRELSESERYSSTDGAGEDSDSPESAVSEGSNDVRKPTGEQSSIADLGI